MTRTRSHHIFRLGTPTSKSEFEDFLKSNPDIETLDMIESQLCDYLETLHPNRKFTKSELADSMQAHLGSTSLYDYGCWVYYPWRRQVIHLLDESEFVALRTDRNKNKITAKEQEILAHKKIGIIGLSVGHAVALTLALERSFGELRIADHDHLDLSNLNRIRSGVHNIGLPKTTIVSREIAELDPFLKVTLFDDGICLKNLDAFLEEGGRLDLLIDECDSLDVKLQSRERARELGIPVVMETSDRGMLDVERFDLDPNTPILYGYMDGVDSTTLEDLTNEEKIPYVLPIIGLENSSLKLRASMFEVERSISTWPQLGSDVTLGGGTVAHVVRRILLNENIPSGRSYLDLLEMIPSSSGEKKDSKSTESISARTFDENDLFQKIEQLDWIPKVDNSAQISRETIADIIGKASLAPSGGNTQPWLWHVIDNEIFLFLDTRKPYAFLDFRYRGSMIALGAASKNLMIASGYHGLSVKETVFDVMEEESFPLVACFSLGTGEVTDSDFYHLLGTRMTNRLNEGRKPLPSGFIGQSIEEYRQKSENSTLRILDGIADINTVRSVISIMDRLVMLNERGHQDLFGELKWSSDFSEKDGINVHSLGLTPSELSGMQIAKDPKVIAKLRELGGGERFSEMNHKALDSSSAIGLVTISDFHPAAFFNAGAEIEEHWLKCTAENVSVYPITGGLYLINRAIHGNGEGLNEEELESLLTCNTKLRELFTLEDDEVFAFLMRYSINIEEPTRSKRKNLHDVLLEL